MVWVNKRNVRVERLRFQLVAAVSGIGVATTMCGGRSSRDGETRDSGGGAGGSSGERGGASGERGGASGATMTGGRGGTRGGAAGDSGASSGTTAEGGTTTTGGTGTGGTGTGGSMPPLGTCDEASSWSGMVRCRGGYVHRDAPTSCPYPPRDGEAGGSAGGRPPDEECATDADCGPNGYCAYSNTDSYTCIHANCERDADCAKGQVCACTDVDGVGVIGMCRRASCTTDADCEGDALCISPFHLGGCFGLETTEFHCQSPSDECWGPDTCEGNPGGCVYDVNSSSFACTSVDSCGRPFVVDGVARRARAVSANDESWLDHSLASTVPAPGLSDDERRAVAERFVEAALMEHASIAAFARFTLQLLALGAPSSLVADATRAMADETRHARTCFALARRYGAEPLAPGPLAMDGALASLELLEVVELAIVEGCIGETVAALEAAWAADGAEDAEVRRALETIAEDEARHAALAFRFVAWASRRDHRVPGLLERRVAEARRATTGDRDEEACERSQRLARHGVLDAATRREARRRALDEIVSGIVTARGTEGTARALRETAVADQSQDPESLSES